jgi:hypothetical protein
MRYLLIALLVLGCTSCVQLGTARQCTSHPRVCHDL